MSERASDLERERERERGSKRGGGVGGIGVRKTGLYNRGRSENATRMNVIKQPTTPNSAVHKARH